MNSIKRLTGNDLRDALQTDGPQESMSNFADPRQKVRSFYSLERFVGRCHGFDKRSLCVHIPRICDVMAPHSIDIPPREIEKIELDVCGSRTFFNTMNEASFYFHVRMLDDALFGVRMFVYLKPGFEREQCTVIWRCYFLDRESRDLCFAHREPFPVARDVEFNGKTFNKRRMAKL